MTYTELKEALYLFGFHENDLLTIKRIKQRHRKLVRKAHPDLHKYADPERIRQLNEAARIIMEYVNSYRFSFSHEEFYRQIPDEHLKHQYSWDPIWAGELEEKKD
ncbi:MAG: molecular chaperone DnaJ [Trichlorobacter sp.]|uniref:molecular chaperone DnaJ n=1 Tax=Trichlorobacter sp. TaxID=2911007 RepID=UPI002560340F|nr:molecular chaperone DnaJ [Trichlorobacter sp.]MDK9717151.1 molecular chaperone DnaJ [Trichlorobacter sp.]